MKTQIVKDKLIKLTYKLKGFAKNLLDLPSYILIMMFENFSTSEKVCLKKVCTKFRDCLSNPHLWKVISINNNSSLFSTPISTHYLYDLVEKSVKLRVISLKYCPNFAPEVLKQINSTCNPFTLQELYLDGNESVTDAIFDCLELSDQEKKFNAAWSQFIISTATELPQI